MRVLRLGYLEGVCRAIEELQSDKTGKKEYVVINNFVLRKLYKLKEYQVIDNYGLYTYIFTLDHCIFSGNPDPYERYICRTPDYMSDFKITKYTRATNQYLPAIEKIKRYYGEESVKVNVSFYSCARAIQDRYRKRLKDYKDLMTHARIREEFLEWYYSPNRPGYMKAKQEFEALK